MSLSGIVADIDTISWLYGLFLAIDANFRLKRKAVSNDSVDPSLSSGWAYFVDDEAYKGFLDSNSDNAQEVVLFISSFLILMMFYRSQHARVTTP
jgi:hypothetical protein